MSVANFSRWTNMSSFGKKGETHQPNGSQTSLASAVSDLSVSDDSSSYVSSGDYGTLIIVIMKAKNLYNRRAISKQNPYCSVRVAKHSDRTKAITRGGQAPLWDHETRFKLNVDDDNRQLKLCVFDQNGSNTEIIGDALIPLKPAYDAPTDVGYDDWFPIYFNKRYVGEVYLEMTFYPRRKSSARSSRRSSVISNIQVPSAVPSANTSISSVNVDRSSAYGRLYSNGAAHHSHSHLPPLPSPPAHSSSSAPLQMKHSESMPILKEDNSQEPPFRSPSPQMSTSRRPARPLPKLPNDQVRRERAPAAAVFGSTAQEDIQRQINDGYEASLFERLKPSASQPFL